MNLNVTRKRSESVMGGGGVISSNLGLFRILSLMNMYKNVRRG